MHAAFRDFKLFNATGQALDGFTPIACSGGLTYQTQDGERSAWIGGYYGEDRTGEPAAPWSSRWQAFDPSRLISFAESLTSRVLMINVEHYGDDGLGRLVDLLETLREYRPDVALGVWSLLPSSEWWTVQNYAQFIDWQAGHPHFDQVATWWRRVGPSRVVTFEAWQARNRLIARKLAPHVDALFPSIYPVYDIQSAGDEWKLARNVDLVIEEARAVAGGLPIFPVYFPFTAWSKKPASPALTQALCRAVKPADGLVLWSDGSLSLEHLAKSADAARSAIEPGHLVTTF